MEKRWTRKKRAAREAGGPEAKPALSGPIRLSEPDDTSAPKRPEGQPSRPAKEIDPALLELEADPVSAEPEPRPPKAPEPEADRPEPEVEPEASRSEPEREPEPEPEPERKTEPEPEPEAEIEPQDPQAPVAPARPVAYRVKRVRRPKPVDPPVEAQPASPETAAQADDPAPALADPRPVEAEAETVPEVKVEAPVETPPAPIPEPVSPPIEPEPTQPEVEAIAPAPAVPEEAAADTPEPEADPWTRIRKFPIDARKLERNRIITATREDPVHSSFDVLRTKLLRALRDNGWSRVAVTSPTEGCGKTFMAANLALSLSRQGNCRTVVLDLDMRHPALARTMNVPNTPSIADFLSGKMPAEEFLRRPGRNPHKIGDNVAFGFNTRREEFAAELLQDDVTAETLKAMEQTLKPDVVLMDMPPALVNDDVLAARPLYDGIILIVGGGMTKPQQVRDVERRLGTDTPLLGVVLNKSEDDTSQNYGY